MSALQKIPEGHNTITPSILCTNAAQAVNLYCKAFGATEISRMTCESGKVIHACVQIGNSRVFLADAMPECGLATTLSNFYLYFDDVDAISRQVKQAGMQEKMAPQDMFWGDRMGSYVDPFGNTWSLATHVRDVSSAELEEGRKKMMQRSRAA
jgi:uncharacterized glyoxalase superfamily protein PhnB